MHLKDQKYIVYIAQINIFGTFLSLLFIPLSLSFNFPGLLCVLFLALQISSASHNPQFWPDSSSPLLSPPNPSKSEVWSGVLVTRCYFNEEEMSLNEPSNYCIVGDEGGGVGAVSCGLSPQLYETLTWLKMFWIKVLQIFLWCHWSRFRSFNN